MMILNISVCVLIFLVGFNLKSAFSDFTLEDKKLLNKLFFYHMFIAVAFHFYISIFGGDAQHYWEAPRTMPFHEIFEMMQGGSPSGTMYFLNYLPSQILELSFFTGNMFYAVLGYFAFLLLYRICKFYFGDFESLSQIKIFGIPIFPWIWFLPNLHFWSSGIGKDTILFLCIIAFLYGLQNLKQRLLYVIIALVLSTAIRPHITLFLLVSFGIGYVFDGRLKGYQKVVIAGIFIVGFASMFNYVLEFVQLESLETDAIEQYASGKSSALNSARSGSGVDISGYPFPLKVFTFLYRPLFFDMNNILAVVASFENLVLLIFTITIFRSKPYSGMRKSDSSMKGSLIFFLLGTVAFSLILGNLGIMLRQKNMFIPVFIIFGFWILAKHYESKKAITA